jgi:hypothetical protein
MTDTPPEPEEDFMEDMETYLYTEKSSNMIYDIRFFDGFVIARPATPAFYNAIRKLSHLQFSKEFDEYWGDPELVKGYMWGSVFGHTVEIQ